MKPDGPIHPADGTLGRPRCLADGGGHRHDVHGYTRTRLKVDNVIFEVDNDNIVPGFTTKVLSVGMLRKQGFKMSLDTEPYGFYTPEEEACNCAGTIHAPRPHFVAAVDANKPHAAIYENVYSFWALMGPEFDKLMAAIGYVPKVQTATAKDHNWTLTGDKVSDCRCKVDNMRAAPTFAISRSAEPRDERVWNIDLMGPMQTKARRQTGVAASLWEYAIHWAADCLNVRADPVSGTSAYEAYFGHKPDMTAICEFGASVAALDNGQRARFDPNGVLTTYLGPARSHGCGAIYVYAQQNYGWEIRQFDIAKAYMLAAPQRAYYLYFPPGFRDYLLARHSGNLPFEPSQYLLRVQKNIYGATDSGKVWFDALCSYLVDELNFTQHAADRCLFCLRLTGAISGCVFVLVYVDDISIYGILSTVARPSAASPNAPTPAVRAACARALRFLNHNAALGVTYTRKENLYLDGRVYCDNQSVIAQLRKRDLSARSRHIRVQLGFIYDALDSGEVEIRYVRSAANPANQLTAEVADRLRAPSTP
ncbi:hypothetical protein JL722_654 [Aureococcus anophagefferens]|nr:hypothetical protein JL722_654 [Aureococcus anophagefferens]